MRTGMKRLFAAFAAGMLLFSTAFAQEDQELTEEDLFAQWDLEADETENVVLDENGEAVTFKRKISKRMAPFNCMV